MRDPVYEAAVEAVMNAMLISFRQLWDQPNGPEVVEGFLARRTHFRVTRDEITILERNDGVDVGAN